MPNLHKFYKTILTQTEEELRCYTEFRQQHRLQLEYWRWLLQQAFFQKNMLDINTIKVLKETYIRKCETLVG